MVVYVEYAFAENFILDGLLLYLAVKCARGRVRALNLLLAAAVGAAEAIVFPILPLPVWAAYLVKILGGALLCVIAVSKGTARTYFFTLVAFFFLTFALGGLLTAAYSFFGVGTEEGNAFTVERAPVALVLGAAGVFAVLIVAFAKRYYRYRKTQRSLFSCELVQGSTTVRWKGFADSGNRLEFRGRPVCVISAVAAFALFGRELREEGRIHVGTVNGGRDSPVFACERMRVGGKVFDAPLFTVGEVASKEYQIILHTAFVEENDGTFECLEGMAAKDKGKRKRCSLSLRKRSVASSAFAGGGSGAVARSGSGEGDGARQSAAHRT